MDIYAKIGTCLNNIMQWKQREEANTTKNKTAAAACAVNTILIVKISIRVSFLLFLLFFLNKTFKVNWVLHKTLIDDGELKTRGQNRQK